MAEVREIAVAILAAGQGKRMGNPNQAKVLAPLFDKPLLGYVLEQASELHPKRVVVIVGFQREAVVEYVSNTAPYAECVVQEKQLGTGHAVQQTLPLLGAEDVDVIILSGDVPLLTGTTLKKLVARHREMGSTATVLSTRVPNPSGYGRIVRGSGGSLTAIVEHRDATPEQLQIDEINSGVYIVRGPELFKALERVNNLNAQGEYYLTDIIGIIQQSNHRVDAWCAPSWEELHGINTTEDLERAAMIMQERSVV